MASQIVDNRFPLWNSPRAVVLNTKGGTSPTIEGRDTGTVGGRSSQVIKTTVGAQAVYQLVRLTPYISGMRLDLIAASSGANLRTAVNALDMTTEDASHPAPVKDAADETALVAAGL